MSPRDRPATDDRAFAPVLLAIVLLAVVQAVLVSLRGELDVDEPFMAAALTRPDDLPATFVHDNVPLAYLLLLGWTTLAGFSTFALRSLSILAFAAAVVVTARVAHRGGTQAGWIAGLLVACSAPLGLDHAATARPYALLMLWAALALWATLRADEHASPWRGALLLLLVHLFGLFTHPVFVFVCAAAAVAGALFGRRRTLLAATPIAAVAVYVLGWWPVLQQTLALPTTSWMPRPTLDDLVGGYTIMWGNRNTYLFAGMVAALVAVRGAAARRLLTRQTGIALVIAVFSLGGAYAVSQVKPVYIAMRTPVIALPALSVGLAGVLVPLGTPLLHAGIALLLVSASGRYAIERWRAPDPAPTRASLALVAERARCDDTIVATGLSYAPLTYFAPSAGLPGCIPIVPFPPEVLKHPGWLDRTPGFADRARSIAPAVVDRISPRGRAWVFLTRRGVMSEEGQAFVEALSSGWTLEETLELRGALFDHVQVFVPSDQPLVEP